MRGGRGAHLPVVVEIVPGYRHPVCGSDEIDLAIVKVGAVFEVREELVVVDPCASGVLKGDAVVVESVADLNVADDDVGLIDSRHTTTEELCTVLVTKQGLVAADPKACLAG